MNMAREKRVPVYVSDDEHQMIADAAYHARLSISAWARTTLVDAARRALAPSTPPALSVGSPPPIHQSSDSTRGAGADTTAHTASGKDTVNASAALALFNDGILFD